MPKTCKTCTLCRCTTQPEKPSPKSANCIEVELSFYRIQLLVSKGYTIREACSKVNIHSKTLYSSTDARLLRELIYLRAITSGSFTAPTKYYPTLYQSEGKGRLSIDPTNLSKEVHLNMFPDEIIDTYLR